MDLATRSDIVRTPRSASHASSDPGVAPSITLRLRSASAYSTLRTVTTPNSKSECPPMYLVALWKLKSAPMSSGRCTKAVANVLSTPIRIPCCFASAHTVTRSHTSIIGFVGDSNHSMYAPSRAAKIAAVSAIFTRRTVTKPFAASSLSRAPVPEYG